jgi:hypothetical protein
MSNPGWDFETLVDREHMTCAVEFNCSFSCKHEKELSGNGVKMPDFRSSRRHVLLYDTHCPASYKMPAMASLTPTVVLGARLVNHMLMILFDRTFRYSMPFAAEDFGSEPRSRSFIAGRDNIEAYENLLSFSHLLAGNHHLDLVDDMTIKVASCRVQRIYESRPTLGLPATKEDRMQRRLFKTRFRVLSGNVIKRAEYPHHALVNFVGPVVIAQESTGNDATTTGAQRKRANDADSICELVRVIETEDVLGKQITTVRTKIVVRCDGISAIAALVVFPARIYHKSRPPRQSAYTIAGLRVQTEHPDPSKLFAS